MQVLPKKTEKSHWGTADLVPSQEKKWEPQPITEAPGHQQQWITSRGMAEKPLTSGHPALVLCTSGNEILEKMAAAMVVTVSLSIPPSPAASKTGF